MVKQDTTKKCFMVGTADATEKALTESIEFGDAAGNSSRASVRRSVDQCINGLAEKAVTKSLRQRWVHFGPGWRGGSKK